MIRRILNLYRFTRSEQRSLFLLCSLLLMLHGLSFLIKRGTETEGNSADFFEAESTMVLLGNMTAESINTVYAFNPDKEPQSKIIEINAADSAKLLDLYGIGPVFAGRIVKYRQLLGGYHDCDQLLEVYGMDSLRYNGFRTRVIVEGSELKQLDINTSGFRDLLRHPYLDYDAVKKLVMYRDRRGPISKPGILWTDSVLPIDLKNKLLPYLK